MQLSFYRSRSEIINVVFLMRIEEIIAPTVLHYLVHDTWNQQIFAPLPFSDMPITKDIQSLKKSSLIGLSCSGFGIWLGNFFMEQYRFVIRQNVAYLPEGAVIGHMNL